MVIRPFDFNINRPQRLLVRQAYRSLRRQGFSRVSAHTTVRTMIDVGYLAGRTAEQMQFQRGR